jgi:hypothetical protein
MTELRLRWRAFCLAASLVAAQCAYGCPAVLHGPAARIVYTVPDAAPHWIYDCSIDA